MTRARELSKLINASSFSVDSDFNVGVNSTSPDVKLDVGGAVLVTGISTFENTTQSTSSTTGALIVSGGVGIAKSLNVGGNLSVAGTITYDDVTNVDSVGVVTARQGINVVGGGLTVTGVSTFFSVVGLKGTPASWHDDSNLGAVQLGEYGALYNYFNNVSLSFNEYQDGASSFKYLTDDEAARYTLDSAGNHVWYTAPTGTADNDITFSERMRITVTGEVRVGSAFSVSQAGVVTATAFHGDASNLTNLPASGDSNDITASLFI